MLTFLLDSGSQQLDNRNAMGKLIMIQGTGSHVGKSLIVAALCRVLRDLGYSVSPFKAQNMALNSGVTPEGLEMGRAQIFQAEAAGITPSVHMNPVLLKPTTDTGAQVVVLGRPIGNYTSMSYGGLKSKLMKVVLESLEKLRSEFEVVVIEGAGSPAEINLRDRDIVNMGLALRLKCPVIIVGDIDRGGVFASLYGTYALLSKNERELVKGFIINKFRGDAELLKSGLEGIERLTNVPVLGVVPYIRGLIVDDEDGVSLDERSPWKNDGNIRVGVIKLPRISNFTDFHPLSSTSGVSLKYVENPLDLHDVHLAVVPGSKSTVADLRFLKDKGFDLMLRLLAMSGRYVLGVCGGYQMLGRKVEDPFGVEGGGGEEGVSLIPATTFLGSDKVLTRVEGLSLFPKKVPVRGYEIHMGRTVLEGEPFLEITRVNGKRTHFFDGFRGENVFGTYVHGIFENDEFRSAFLEYISGVPVGKFSYLKLKEEMIKRIADFFVKGVDVERIIRIVEGG